MASITFTAAGGVRATSFTASSSREKKKDISKSELDATSLLKNIEVVNFKYKEDSALEPHIGFIAEDTDPLLSTLNRNQMDLGNCIGVLIKAVQELTEKVEGLEKKVGET